MNSATWAKDGAPPCASCGTTGGAVWKGTPGPRRVRGLCDRCYEYHRLNGKIESFLIVPRGYHGVASRHRKRHHREMAARVSRHEGTAEAWCEGGKWSRDMVPATEGTA